MVASTFEPMNQPPDQDGSSPGPGTYPRGPRCELILKVEYESLGQLRSDYLSSLGSGGLFLRTELPLSVGQVLKMTISFPAGLPPLSVIGEVRWTASGKPHPSGVGVEFKEVDEASRKQIEALVSGASQSQASEGPRPLRAVLLEANPVLRDIFKFQMSRFALGGADRPIWNLDLVCTSTPDELLQAIGERSTQLAILDFENQASSQSSLLAEIRNEALHRELPIIVLGDSEGLPPNSRTMWVKKPFSVKPLFTTLMMLLDREGGGR
jgi:uncharacterized protein (TIGR02266 family)